MRKLTSTTESATISKVKHTSFKKVERINEWNYVSIKTADSCRDVNALTCDEYGDTLTCKPEFPILE